MFVHSLFIFVGLPRRSSTKEKEDFLVLFFIFCFNDFINLCRVEFDSIAVCPRLIMFSYESLCVLFIDEILVFVFLATHSLHFVSNLENLHLFSSFWFCLGFPSLFLAILYHSLPGLSRGFAKVFQKNLKDGLSPSFKSTLISCAHNCIIINNRCPIVIH